MDSVKPVRLQLSRKAGFRLQDVSLAANGLPAVNVARPSKWGNPFKVGDPGWRMTGQYRKAALSQAEAVELFRSRECGRRIGEIVHDLRGKNLACWCRPGTPCHADVLLALANRPTCESVLHAKEQEGER